MLSFETGLQQLLERAASVLGRSAAELPDVTLVGDTRATLHEVVSLIAEFLRTMPARTTRQRVADAAAVLLEATTLLDELDRALLDQRLHAMSRVQESLGRLRGISALQAMLDRAPEEACRAGAFDRALLFRVEGSQLGIAGAHFRHDPAWAAQVVAVGRKNPPPLTHMLLETEMLRRRRAMLVRAAAEDPRTYKPLVLATETREYVAAPIMPEGRVIGFFHADCHSTGRPLDDLDRDALGLFAEGFGYAIQRTILLERLKSQRQQVRRLIASTGAVMDELADTEVELSDGRGLDGPVARTSASVFVAPESRIDALLTPREREVLSLMASGATNQTIANRLVIAEATVKSHVKHILRKLRASNRAEAVSRFMRIAAGTPLDD
ncbi:MAG: response regulator containing a CheY-like receiver domain and an DNA-binding domain [Solirubrobacterales bacterium]|jgi:DNA-binding CsgD family transcriptional regulator|nr:response regulator containing a CheY-like receiver domain and an DNA-binding domain [Solirubrobacterales bacterium]